MKRDLKIGPEDIRWAEELTRVFGDCYSQNQYDCFSDFAPQASVCFNCPLARFKAEIYLQAKPFWDGYHKLAAFYAVNPRERYLALYHLIFGLGAIYSANQRAVPAVSEEIIQEIAQRVQNNPPSPIREIVSDLKSLSLKWYESFYSVFHKFGLPDDQLWVNNILLLKIFLEAIWKSENGNGNEELINKISEFLREEREKNKDP